MPPLITVGSNSPASSSAATIVVVVVLPWVPRHRDVGFQPHQLGQHLGPAHHRQALQARLVQFRIARFDRARRSRPLRRPQGSRPSGLQRSCAPLASSRSVILELSGPSPAPHSHGSAAPRRCPTCRCRQCRQNGSGPHRREALVAAFIGWAPSLPIPHVSLSFRPISPPYPPASAAASGLPTRSAPPAPSACAASGLVRTLAICVCKARRRQALLPGSGSPPPHRPARARWRSDDRRQPRR